MNKQTFAVILVAILGIAVLNFKEKGAKESQFDIWKKEYGMEYRDGFEEFYRQKIFAKSVQKMQVHNADDQQTYKIGLNQFSALSQEEFSQMFLTLKVPQNFKKIEIDQSYKVADTNWIEHGAVTPVKNQGQCGSCWAFSTTGGLQGLHKLVYGQLVSFSESHLMDCSTYYGNQGCDGGLMINAYQFVNENGIMSEQDYPYVPKQQDCRKEKGPYKFSDYVEVTYCVGLANSITARPVSVAVDATNWSPYKEGVFSNCRTNINHGVTLVGTSNGNWLVKNSWGTSWGNSGYIVLASGNTCGICSMASYPVR